MASRASTRGTPSKSLTHTVGDRVIVGTRAGYVRFVGTTSFAAGNWLGIELDKPEGKNDGSVAGERYFECAAKHGLFVLEAKAKKLLDSTKSTPTKAKTSIPSSIKNSKLETSVSKLSRISTPLGKSNTITAKKSASVESQKAVAELEKQVEELKRKHADELAAAKKKHSEEIKSIDQSRNKATEFQQPPEFKRELENYKSKAELSENEKKDALTTVSCLRKELNDLRKELVALELDVSSKNQNNLQLATKFSEESRRRAELESKFVALTANAKAQAQVAEDEMAQIKADNERQTEECSSLQNQLASLQDSIAILGNSKAGVENNNEYLRLESEAKTQSIVQLTTISEAQREQILKLERDHASELDQMRTSHKNEVSKLNLDNSSILESKEKIVYELEIGKKQHVEQLARIVELESRINEIQAQHSETVNGLKCLADGSSNEIGAALAQRESDIACLKAKVQELEDQRKSSKDELTSQADESSRTIERLTSKLVLEARSSTEANNQIRVLNEKVEEIKEGASETDALALQYKDQIATLRNELEESQKQKRISTSSLNVVKEDLRRREVELCKANEIVAKCKSSLDTNSGKIDALESDLKTAVKDREAFESELHHTQNKLEQCKKKIEQINEDKEVAKITQLKTSNAVLGHSLEMAETELQTIRASSHQKLEKVTAELTKFEKDFAELEIERNILQSNNELLKERLNTSDAVQSMKPSTEVANVVDAEIERLTTRLEGTESLLMSAREERDAAIARAQVAVEQNSTAVIEARISELHAQVIERDEMLALAEIQLDDARAGIDEAADLESERFELLADNAALRRQIAQARLDVSDIKNKLEQYQRDKAAAEIAMESSKKMIAEVMDASAAETADEGGYIRLSRRLMREKLAFEDEIQNLKVDVDQQTERALKAEKQLNSSRATELQALLLDVQKQLDEALTQVETLSGKKRDRKRAKAMLELVNVRELQNENNSLKRELQKSIIENRRLKTTLQSEISKLDQLEVEHIGLKKRLKLRKPIGDEDSYNNTVIKRRIYCDECEQFDIHDTADCPHINRKLTVNSASKTVLKERQFCDTCEEFGHTTDDCPDADFF